MNILFLSLGDISDEVSSSGTPYNLYRNLTKEVGNVEFCSANLNTTQQVINSFASFSPDINLWRERKYKNSYIFNQCTLNVEKVVKKKIDLDYILQNQTMFSPLTVLDDLKIPLGIYTDYTIALASKEYPLWAPFKTVQEYSWWYQKEKKLFQKAKHIFTFSNQIRRSVIADYGIDEKKVHSIKAGSHFTPIDKKIQKDFVKKILLVGRDYKRKGVVHLIEAFNQLRQHYPDIELCIVGCKINQEYDGVTNIPQENNRQKMHEIFLDSYVFVLPSIAEPFGYVFIEAMSWTTLYRFSYWRYSRYYYK